MSKGEEDDILKKLFNVNCGAVQQNVEQHDEEYYFRNIGSNFQIENKHNIDEIDKTS